MTCLKLLSGGAVQGLVSRLAPSFKKLTGMDVEGEFGAVGAMAEKLRAGQPADLVILSEALVAKLAEDKLVVHSSMRNVGIVETALAVPHGHSLVSANSQATLRAALLEANAIYVPDIKHSTAGIHVATVLERLGIAGTVETRLKVYANGATAMQHLAQSTATRPIGCTQATEIINTPGVTLSGALPPGCNLATPYTAAITGMAIHAREAQILIDLLTSPDRLEIRNQMGFMEPA